MKKRFIDMFYGKSSLGSGLIALMIISLIVLGCTCNQKDGFKLGKEDSNSSQGNRGQDKPVDEKNYEKADASKAEIPTDEELQDMVREDLLAFDSALKNGSFQEFYNRISKFWQKQTTPGKLKDGFQKLIDGKADISGIKNLKASFSPAPKIDSSKRVKVLEVYGTFPTKPADSTFELKYIPEGKEWKLIGCFVRTTIYSKK